MLDNKKITIIRYSKFNGKGEEYGYEIPANTKKSQAAGRPIRDLKDHGEIIFLDWRYKYININLYSQSG